METRTEALNKCMLYTLTELEPVLGVSHQTLVRYCKDGKLKARKVEGKWKVSQKDLDAYVNGVDAVKDIYIEAEGLQDTVATALKYDNAEEIKDALVECNNFLIKTMDAIQHKYDLYEYL